MAVVDVSGIQSQIKTRTGVIVVSASFSEKFHTCGGPTRLTNPT